MTRTFVTTTEQDAALAWVAEVRRLSEAAIIREFTETALADLVAAYLDSEGARVYELFKKAPSDQQAAVIATLEAKAEPRGE
jgi:hypothetical protein